MDAESAVIPWRRLGPTRRPLEDKKTTVMLQKPEYGAIKTALKADAIETPLSTDAAQFRVVSMDGGPGQKLRDPKGLIPLSHRGL